MTSANSTRRVFLTGFMGAGKTSVGRALAQRLGWKFYDLDEAIEARERATIAHIFATAGEPAFRQIEAAALLELLEKNIPRTNFVTALGGGAFVQPRNREALRRFDALTILLDAPLEELRRRCHDSAATRPLAHGLASDPAQFEKLFNDRRAAYGLARFRVETGGKSVEAVAAEIERILEIHTTGAGVLKPGAGKLEVKS